MNDRFDARLRRRFSQIECLFLDVDGVLTDGGMYYSEHGESLKKFNTKDGMGIERVRAAGIKVVIISGENSEATRKRFDKVKVDEVHVGIKQKGVVFQEVIKRLDVHADRCAYVGDDVNDLPVLEQVGLPIAVADAVDEVRQIAWYVTHRSGGMGAVREIAEILLKYRK